jgi:hypothetical protein
MIKKEEININKTYLLKDVIGTRYLIPTHNKSMDDFFNICKSLFEETGNKIKVDIAFCKFNPDNYTRIDNYIDFIDFTDSDNPAISGMLEHNKNVNKYKLLERNNTIKFEDIPKEINIESLKSFLSSIDIDNPNPSIIYRIPTINEMNGKKPDIAILLAMMIVIMNPKIKIDLTNQSEQFFDIFKTFWRYTGKVNRDSYLIKWDYNYMKIGASFNDTDENCYYFYIPGVGEISEKELNENFKVIPFIFGDVKFSELKKDPELNNIYKDIQERLIYEIKRNKVKKKKLISELSFNKKE